MPTIRSITRTQLFFSPCMLLSSLPSIPYSMHANALICNRILSYLSSCSRSTATGIISKWPRINTEYRRRSSISRSPIAFSRFNVRGTPGMLRTSNCLIHDLQHPLSTGHTPAMRAFPPFASAGISFILTTLPFSTVHGTMSYPYIHKPSCQRARMDVMT